MERRSRNAPPDPSDFFRLNEAVADELARLDAEGHLDRLTGLLGATGSELWVTAVRPRDGLEEPLGVVRARAADPAPVAPLGAADPRDGGCCGPDDPARVAAVRAEYERPAGGWDHQGVLTARSRFRVVYADGSAREVYMPDHVCPTCFQDAGNHIESCARRCASCGFSW